MERDMGSSAMALPSYGGGSNQYMGYPAMGGSFVGGTNNMPNSGASSWPSYGTVVSGGYTPSSVYPSIGGSGALPMSAGNGVAQYSGNPGGSGNPGSPTSAGGPGTVPTAPGLPSASNPAYPPNASASGGYGLQGGAASVPTQDPNFSNQWAEMLQGILGQGMSPYNLSAYLPSTGGSTTPGQVAAPMTPGLQQLQQFLSGTSSSGLGQSQIQQLLQNGGLTGNLATTAQGAGGLGSSPYLNNLANNGGLTGPMGTLASTGGLTGPMGTLASTGDPIDQTPAWQAMVQAENQNTQLGETNLKEQMASMGDLSSSNAANAMSQYLQQTTLGQNAQLTQAQTQAQQQAVQNMLTAGTTGINTQLSAGDTGIGTELAAGTTGYQGMLNTGEFGVGTQAGMASALPGLEQSTGEYSQGLDQQSITNLMQEYFQTSPEENPLLGMESSLATTYPSVYTKQGGIGSALVSSAGGILSGIGDLAGLF
jgi:hypothetical protein